MGISVSPHDFSMFFKRWSLALEISASCKAHDFALRWCARATQRWLAPDSALVGRDFHQPWQNSGDLTREQNMGYHEDNTWDNGCLSMTITGITMDNWDSPSKIFGIYQKNGWIIGIQWDIKFITIICTPAMVKTMGCFLVTAWFSES